MWAEMPKLTKAQSEQITKDLLENVIPWNRPVDSVSQHIEQNVSEVQELLK